MTTWTVHPPAGLSPEAQAAFEHHFGSLDAVFALDAGEPIAIDPLSLIFKIELAGQTYYVKRYHGAGKNLLRRWLGRPRVQAEWENLRHFAAWNIPTATIVAWGMERRFGAFSRGALITAALPATQDLALIAYNHDPRLKDPYWIASLSSQLARLTRIMHAHRFTHNDLKWRNLLVNDATPPQLYLIDCPNGAFWQGPFLEYRIIKDLACLDKIAKYHLTRTQRLRFYLDYMEIPKLAPTDKHRLRRIITFFEGRE